ncbi:unnamed protein product [Periconia digitata]|uniref:NAD-dependent epimerase/dehydratase domain-containing protein n=1 Tax=Periconia digitata TaxID=1303443 RepID=A0A9W4UQU7_9PLEO|nr:unnamed protein product [Periconia digitata]
MSEPQTSIPKGSIILITGANGFVASHTAQQFLARGYRVRGTVRDLKRASWLLETTFKQQATNGSFELVVIPDFSAPHAFDEAIKGVAAVAHVAVATDFNPDPNKVIPQTIASTTSLMEAAQNEPSVKQFVYTSSIVTATMPVPSNPTHVGSDTWNDKAVELAWAPPPYDASRGMLVYMANKVATEKAVWEFVRGRKPGYAVNAVSPAAIMGEPLHRSHAEVAAAHVRSLYQGKVEFLSSMPATLNINVKDVALLHVAAILDPKVQNARLQAWAQFCNWNDILAIMRKAVPDREFIDDLPNLAMLSLSTDLSEPLALLKKWGGQDDWISLEDTITDNVRALVKMGF